MGYFDLYLERFYSEGEIVTIGKDLYFKSVILFIERVRDLVIIKGNTLIRTNLNTYLRNATLRWYTVELLNLERTNLKNDSRGIKE